MSKKFEQLLEYVVNNETEKAQALFHDIVVGKSREIYENLIASEAEEMEESDIGGGQVESLLDEISAEEGDMKSEGDDDMEMPSDDMGDEHSDGDMGDEHMDMHGDEGHEEGEPGAEDMEDRLVDLEDALSQLKAEFDDLMSHEAGEEEHGEEGEEDMEDGEEGMEDGEEEHDEEGEEDLDEDVVLEYTEKVGETYKSGKGVSGKTEDSGTNKTSPINAKKRTQSIEGGPIQTKDGGQGNHGVKTPGKLTTATTKGAGTKMTKVQDMKKV